jgi:signal transduction histidine kinase
MISLASIILTNFFIKTYKVNVEDNLKNKAKIFAKDLAASCLYALSVNQQKTLHYLVERAILKDDVVSVEIYNKDSGEVIEAKITDAEINKIIPDNKIDFNSISETIAVINKSKRNARFFEVLTPIFKKGEDIFGIRVSNDEINSIKLKEAIGAVRVILSFANTDQKIARTLNTVVLISIVVIIFCLGLSLLLVRIILNPVEKLSISAKNMSNNNFSYNDPLVKIEEIEHLVEAFNSIEKLLDKNLKSLSNEESDIAKTKNKFELVIDKMKVVKKRLLESERFATIERLAAILTYEIKNPLTSLQNIMFFFSQTKNFSDERSVKMIEMFFSEIDRINKILSHLLSFSRVENIQKIDTYVDDVVHSTTVMVNLPKNIEVKENFESVKAEIDSSKLSKALEQLIINARDSMSDGGTIYISVKLCEDFVKIKIKDTGTGINDKIINNIWNPLFTTKLNSMGLGLAIVKKIVELHFGRITVTSKENKGTEFSIDIPVKEKNNE